jgi:hypothetical protein
MVPLPTDRTGRHVIPGLYQAGHRVMAAQNPLTSLADDIANTANPTSYRQEPKDRFAQGRPIEMTDSTVTADREECRNCRSRRDESAHRSVW